MDNQTRTEVEAAVFRRMVHHFRQRTDVQNIDLMNLANFCRNFRDRSQSMQWVYTGGDFHRLADFGFLLFQ